jgi:hypothetical protein
VVEVLHAGASFSQFPTQTEMTAWIQNDSLHVTVVRPKDAQTLSELQSREWTYVVDLSTMKIVWTGFGSYDGSKPSSVEEGLSQLMTLLGK